jgi:hypothetical protein
VCGAGHLQRTVGRGQARCIASALSSRRWHAPSRCVEAGQRTGAARWVLSALQLGVQGIRALGLAGHFQLVQPEGVPGGGKA